MRREIYVSSQQWKYVLRRTLWFIRCCFLVDTSVCDCVLCLYKPFPFFQLKVTDGNIYGYDQASMLLQKLWSIKCCIEKHVCTNTQTEALLIKTKKADCITAPLDF